MPSPFISVICFRTKEANKQRKKNAWLRLVQNIHLAISKLYRYNSDYVATSLRRYVATRLRGYAANPNTDTYPNINPNHNPSPDPNRNPNPNSWGMRLRGYGLV